MEILKDPVKVKLFQELLKIIVMVNSAKAIDMSQTEIRVSDSLELNYAIYLLKKVEIENPTLSFEQHRDIAMKQVSDTLPKKKNDNNSVIEI